MDNQAVTDDDDLITPPTPIVKREGNADAPDASGWVDHPNPDWPGWEATCNPWLGQPVRGLTQYSEGEETQLAD